MKILICMVTLMTNRGVDALVTSKAAELAKVFPGAQIDVMTRNVTANRPFAEQRGLRMVEDPFYGWRQNFVDKAGLLAPLAMKLGGKPMQALEEVGRLLPSYDLAVFTGGDNISSDYGSPDNYFVPVRKLMAANVPVVFLGQSIGPFRAVEHRESFLSVARHSPLVTVRETASYNYVLNDLGMAPQTVRLTADTAFLLEPTPGDFGAKIMQSFGLDPARPVIALSVSGGISLFASADNTSHLDALERLTHRLLAETGAQVLLIPHVEDTDPSNNDLIVADALMRRLDFNPNVRLARGFLTSNEFKAIIARCQMVVAERMHVAIGGLSSGVPTFVIGYSVKGHGIMSDTLGVDSRDEGLVVPLDTFLSDPQSDEKVLAVWNRRDAYAAILQQRLPEMRAKAKLNFELLPGIVAEWKAGRKAG